MLLRFYRPVQRSIATSFTTFIYSSLRTFSTTRSNMSNPIEKPDEEWRAILTPDQFRVLRKKGTEPPGTDTSKPASKNGIYECVACGNPLYKASTKFDSGCGWPAFYEGIPGAIKTHEDNSLGMHRTEIMCARCGGHLGHVFKGEGFKTPTDERHCVNSICLKYKM